MPKENCYVFNGRETNEVSLQLVKRVEVIMGLGRLNLNWFSGQLVGCKWASLWGRGVGGWAG